MSVKVGSLLAAAEEAEERCRRYGRLAAQLVRLAFALYVPASVATAAGLVTYMLYSVPHSAIAGLVMWIVGHVVYILSGVYSYKAVKPSYIHRDQAPHCVPSFLFVFLSFKRLHVSAVSVYF